MSMEVPVIDSELISLAKEACKKNIIIVASLGNSSNKNKNPFLFSDCVLGIGAIDKNKNLWVGTDEGLSKINLSNYSISNYRYNKKDKDISYYAIITMYVDDKGNLYVGNNKGVYLYDEKIDDFNKVFGIENGLIDENIYSITKDKYDNLWIGTNQGLHKVDSKSTRAYPYSVGNTKTSEWGKVRSIFFDNDNMWVGTAENGLKRVDLKNNKFKSFEVDEKDNNKLQSLTVRDIIKDSSGDIWIATEKGISEFIKI